MKFKEKVMKQLILVGKLLLGWAGLATLTVWLHLSDGYIPIEQRSGIIAEQIRNAWVIVFGGYVLVSLWGQFNRRRRCPHCGGVHVGHNAMPLCDEAKRERRGSS